MNGFQRREVARRLAFEVCADALNKFPAKRRGEIPSHEAVTLNAWTARIIESQGHPIDDDDILAVGDLVANALLTLKIPLDQVFAS